MKIFFRRIHLYMGLSAGLIIMITCLSGAILVFETELQHLFFKQRYFVTAAAKPLTADSLISSVHTNMPQAKINGIKIYADKERTAEISITMPAPKKKEQGKLKAGATAKQKGAEGTRLTAFVNPYSGEVTEIYNHRKSFFYWVMDVHRWMLGGDIGKMVVGICTLIFLFILITGIVLWWPKNKQLLKQRLKIKKDAGFKRLNHDYHIVLGFYTSIFLFVLAFTGLAWSFDWFNKGIYSITNSSMERPKAPKTIYQDSTQKIMVEAALQIVMAKNSEGLYYNINIPKDSTDSYAINLLAKDASHESASDTYYVDAFTGSVNGIQKFTDRNQGQRVRATFKPIHVASIYGMPSKIIGFIACLLGTFFPVSGFIMWLNRTRKKKAVTTAL